MSASNPVNTNRRLANASYADKVVEYRGSEYAITTQIADVAPDEWNLARLDARQGTMARHALGIWRSDFA